MNSYMAIIGFDADDGYEVVVRLCGFETEEEAEITAKDCYLYLKNYSLYLCDSKEDRIQLRDEDITVRRIKRDVLDKFLFDEDDMETLDIKISDFKDVPELCRGFEGSYYGVEKRM